MLFYNPGFRKVVRLRYVKVKWLFKPIANCSNLSVSEGAPSWVFGGAQTPLARPCWFHYSFDKLVMNLNLNADFQKSINSNLNVNFAKSVNLNLKYFKKWMDPTLVMITKNSNSGIKVALGYDTQIAVFWSYVTLGRTCVFHSAFTPSNNTATSSQVGVS